MAVTDFFAGEIATELLKMLITITRKACLCKPSAEQLKLSIDELLPIINEIKYSGVELNEIRQMQLDALSRALFDGYELAAKVLASSRWNVYKNLQLSRKMDKIEKKISRFLQGPLQAHVLADVHHVRFETAERFDRLDGSARRLEQRLESMKIGCSGGGWLLEAVNNMDQEELYEGNSVKVGMGLELGKRKVKDMLLDRDDLIVIGIVGIGGSGKTTLAREIYRDDQVRSYFNNRILFLTVSQSPNVEQLRQKIWGFLSESKFNGCSDIASQWTLQYDNWNTVTPTLVILDDVWTHPDLQQLIFKVPGCKTLVVSRINFPTVLNSTYELELLREEEALSLFCESAFGRTSIPPGFDKDLIKQVVEKCKGLPLALKVIGASLRDQSEMYWRAAKNSLSRAQPINDSHEFELLNRMKLSIDSLSIKVRDCFLDLGSFREDKKIPLDVLINIWTELHDIEEEVDAYAILVELSNKNLLTLVKDHERAEETYSSYYEISVSQHDVLRDIAIHMSSQESVNQRKRLVMARRENGVPKEWERNIDQPFLAKIVSIHTGEMKEMDWLNMKFPEAEVLILNFDSSDYFLPPFIENMPKLRALVVINYGKTAELHNLSVLGKSSNLRSIWFEKVTIPELPKKTILPLKNMQKISLLLCKINLKDESEIDLSHLFPRLTHLTMDHCVEMTRLPSSICQVKTLKSLSITNCELEELPSDFGKLIFLQILRVYACPKLKRLPSGIKNLIWLEHIDVSQCVNLECLNEEIGGCVSLKKIDMRECVRISRLPKSIMWLGALRRVVCDEEISCEWKEMGKELPGLFVHVVEQSFDLDSWFFTE